MAIFLFYVYLLCGAITFAIFKAALGRSAEVSIGVGLLWPILLIVLFMKSLGAGAFTIYKIAIDD